MTRRANRFRDAPTALRVFWNLGGETHHHDLIPGQTLCGAESGCDLVIDDESVSRRHARIDLRPDGSSTVCDLDSTNRTWLDGRSIPAGQEVAFGEQAVIHLGRVELKFRRLAAGDLCTVIRSKLGAKEEPGPAEGRESTTVIAQRPGPLARWMEVVNRVDAHLKARRSPDAPGAMSELCDAVNGTGSAVVTAGAENQPRVCAGWGELGWLESAWERVSGSRRVSGAPFAFDLESRQGRVGAVRLPSADGDVLLMINGKADLVHEALPMLPWALFQLLRAGVGGVRQPGDAEPDLRIENELLFPDGYVPGHSTACRHLHDALRSLINRDTSVLITGETGVGKEMVARTIATSSRRAQGPFVAVNCAGIPADLFESELFGIEHGVATGVGGRPGKIREADGGVLFLDEVGDLPLPLQAKLLRVLDHHEVDPVGARCPVPVDIRILAATNRDLAAMGERFRSDLYYRLAACEVRVPPLRERHDDLVPLIQEFLDRVDLAGEGSELSVAASAVERLAAASWPGNIRQLQHTVQDLAARSAATGGLIDGQLVDAVLVRPAAGESALPENSLNLRGQTVALEKRLIPHAMQLARGNKTEAARLLGISRQALANKIRRLDLEGSF